MTIVIYDGNERTTFDNDSQNHDPGKINYGVIIINKIFMDGFLSKAETKRKLNKFIKEFLK